MPYEISSTSNERIKGLIRLRVRHHRDTDKVFVVEGNVSMTAPSGPV
ncbi:MAG TPA: hypothetical protein VGB33_10445 [Acidimicrobiia bacterium]|jgi:hypothetical protein